MITKPYSFQREDAIQIERFGGRALVASEMGTGKTLTSLLWAWWNPEVRPIIVVCPAFLKWQWQRECYHHFGMASDVCEGRRPDHTRHRVVIVNYDILPEWLPWLTSLYPQLVIIDEIHYLCNPSAQRSQMVKQLCQGVPHVLGLSGTPLTKRPLDLWFPLHIIKPELFPVLMDYGKRYCQAMFTNQGWNMTGADNLDELHRVLVQNVMVRRLKSDVLKDLPKKRHLVIPMPLGDDLGDYYRQAEDDFIAWLAQQSRRAAYRAASNLALSKAGGLKRLAGRLKLPSVLGWLDSYFDNTDDKLIVFAIQQEIIRKMHERFSRESVIVNGLVHPHERQRSVDRFQEDPDCRFLFGNIQAAGVGLNLTAAPAVAFAELGWTPGEHQQCIDRTHRIGQNRRVTAFWLIAHNTIEEHICRLLVKRQGTLDTVLDGVKTTDLNIVQQITNQFLQRNQYENHQEAQAKVT